jgi:hypothetical protein
VGEMYEFNDPECSNDIDKIIRETRLRNHKLWHFDIDYMIGEVEEGYKRLLAEA